MPGIPPDRLPVDLPIPADDGACDHLLGIQMPSVPLPSTSGDLVNLAASRGTSVVYVYPHTGRPDVPTPNEWDRIPGARGCTPQACAFRDHAKDLLDLGARVYGVSADDSEWQREASKRLQLPFELLSDADFEWSKALRLPTFRFEGHLYLKRVTLILERDRIRRVFYPVFPPDRNAAEVLAFLEAERHATR